MNEEVSNRSLVGGRRIAAAFTMLFFSAQTIFISAFWVLMVPYEFGIPISLFELWEGTMTAFIAMSVPVFSYSAVITVYLASSRAPYRLKVILARALVVTVIFYAVIFFGLSTPKWFPTEQEDLWILALIILISALAAAAGSAWIVHRYVRMVERAEG